MGRSRARAADRRAEYCEPGADAARAAAEGDGDAYRAGGGPSAVGAAAAFGECGIGFGGRRGWPSSWGGAAADSERDWIGAFSARRGSSRGYGGRYRRFGAVRSLWRVCRIVSSGERFKTRN